MTVTEARPLPPPVLVAVREIEVPRLPISERVRRIESLALKAELLDDAETEVLLLAVAHKSLRGAALWSAWLVALDAIGVRNLTSRFDGEYGRYADQAEAAIEALIYGTRPGRKTYGGGGVA